MLAFGLSISLIGMGTVLFALVLLMGVIKALSGIMALTKKSTVFKGNGGEKNLVVTVATPRAQMENDEEIIAVIAAALAVALRKS